MSWARVNLEDLLTSRKLVSVKNRVLEPYHPRLLVEPDGVREGPLCRSGFSPRTSVSRMYKPSISPTPGSQGDGVRRAADDRRRALFDDRLDRLVRRR
jgi:hypothetical protein